MWSKVGKQQLYIEKVRQYPPTNFIRWYKNKCCRGLSSLQSIFIPGQNWSHLLHNFSIKMWKSTPKVREFRKFTRSCYELFIAKKKTKKFHLARALGSLTNPECSICLLPWWMFVSNSSLTTFESFCDISRLSYRN